MNFAAESTCPLCSVEQIESFYQDRKRQYLRCSNCKLVFVPSKYHLSYEAERAEYDMHQNSPDERGYRRFLSRLVDPLVQRLPAQAQGLDFGCGPGPTLSVMLQEAGHGVADYDPFYANDPTLLGDTYDFITATEVVEHLRNPKVELERLFAILRDGGYLGIMTKLVIDREAFKQWHYKNDATHISFFSKATFNWLSHHWQAKLEFIGNDVVLIKKCPPTVRKEGNRGNTDEGATSAGT